MVSTFLNDEYPAKKLCYRDLTASMVASKADILHFCGCGIRLTGRSSEMSVYATSVEAIDTKCLGQTPCYKDVNASQVSS